VTLGRDVAHAPIEAIDADGGSDHAADISVDRVFDTQDSIEGLDSPEAVDKGMAADPASGAEDEADEAEA